MNKKVAMLTAMTLFAALVPIAVIAAQQQTVGGDPHARVNAQGSRWTTQSSTTSSSEFEAVPGLGDNGGNPLFISGRNTTSATISVDVAGGPVDFRVLQNGREMKPGAAHFDPTNGTTSYSFTFVPRDVSGRARCRAYELQWRAADGRQVTLNHGDLVVTYQKAKVTEPCL